MSRFLLLNWSDGNKPRHNSLENELRSGRLQPVCFEAIAQMHARTMQHHPQIVNVDAEHLTDYFASQTIDLPKGESARGARWHVGEAVVKSFPKTISFDRLS